MKTKSATSTKTTKTQKYFGDTQLNPLLKATTDISAVKDADVVVLAVPSIAIEPIVRQVDAVLEKPAVFVNVAKGFHPVTNERLSDVIRHCVSRTTCPAW